MSWTFAITLIVASAVLTTLHTGVGEFMSLKAQVLRKMFRSGINVLGILISGISLYLFAGKVVALDFPEIYELLYQYYAMMAAGLFDIAFFWLDFEFPQFVKDAIFLYVLFGAAALRGMLFISDILNVRRELTDENKMTISINQTFVGYWLQELKFLIPLMLPIWPLISLSMWSTGWFTNAPGNKDDLEDRVNFGFVFSIYLIATLAAATATFLIGGVL